MAKIKRLNIECPTLDELRKEKIPEVPEDIKKVIWSTYKIKRKIQLTEETLHYVDLMAIYYGVGRSVIISNAIKKMFSEVAPEIGKKRIQQYEKHLEIEKLEQLNDLEMEEEDKERAMIARREERLKETSEKGAKKKRGFLWQFYTTEKLLGYKRKKDRSGLLKAREAWQKKYGSERDKSKDKGKIISRDP